MPIPQGRFEVYSALDDVNILEPCRVLSDAVEATCDVCRFVAQDGLHAPSVIHGFFCGIHCPICCGLVEVPDAERAAMALNRQRITMADVVFAKREAKARYWRERQRVEYRGKLG